jgi:preprotein translocase subunit SecF
MRRPFRRSIDGNLTTIIAAVFLFQFGTGPVKGFGISLDVGICSFLCLPLSWSLTLIYDLWLMKSERPEIERLTWNSLKPPNSITSNTTRSFFGVSVVLGLLSVGALLYRGKNILSIDFTGGTLIQGYFEKAGDSPWAKCERRFVRREVFVGADLQGVPGDTTPMILRFKTQQSNADRQGCGRPGSKTGFVKSFPNNPVCFRTGRSLWDRWSAVTSCWERPLMAILFSFLGIVVYVAFRFKNWIWGVSPAFSL